MAYGPDTLSDFQLRALFVWFAVTFFVVAGVVVLASMFIHKNIDIHPTMVELDSYALIMSPEGVSYHDEILDRVYVLEIDRDEIFATQAIEERLGSAFDMGEFNLFAAEITFFDMEMNRLEHKGKEIDPIYVNEELFLDGIVIAETGYEGKGGYTLKDKKFLMRYKDKGMMVPGIMKAAIIVPNS
jgi:hypothetical protein